MNSRTLALALAVAGCLLSGSPRATGAQAPSVPHVLALSSYAFLPDVLAGEPSSLEHPGGTVLVAVADVGGLSPRVEEWDLATARPLRVIPLPGWPSALTLSMVRAGGYLHVVSQDERSRIHYVTLTDQLRIETSLTLEHGKEPFIASDGALVAIQWCDASGAPGVDVLDALGGLRGRHLSGPTTTHCLPLDQGTFREAAAPLAVLDGHVYSLAAGPPFDEAGPSAELARLDSNARVESTVRVGDEGILWAVRGRLLTEAWDLRGRSCRFVELNRADLEPVRRHDFAPDPLGPGVCPQPDAVGAVSGAHVAALTSPIESGAQSHVSRGEDVPLVEARLFYREGSGALMEFDRRTRSAWLTWTGPAVSPPAVASGGDGSPAVPIAPPHVVTLPLLQAAPDVVAGRAPGAAHPRGTVFVVGLEPSHASPTVSEWDLSTATRMRQVALPGSFKAYRIVSTERRLFVAAVDGLDRVHVLRLAPGLGLEANDVLGTGEIVAMAADTSLAAVAWVPVPEYRPQFAERTSLQILDATGVTLGAASVAGQVHSMAVAGGRVVLDSVTVPVTESPDPSERLSMLDSSGRSVAGFSSSRVDFERVYAAPAGIVLVDPVAATAECRSLRDLTPIGELGFPYVEPSLAPLRSDVNFDLAASPSGRLVSTRGDVLDPGFSAVERRFAVGPLASKALFVGEEAAIVDWRGPRVPGRIRFVDP